VRQHGGHRCRIWHGILGQPAPLGGNSPNGSLLPVCMQEHSLYILHKSPTKKKKKTPKKKKILNDFNNITPIIIARTWQRQSSMGKMRKWVRINFELITISVSGTFPCTRCKRTINVKTITIKNTKVNTRKNGAKKPLTCYVLSLRFG